ncbi:MAG: hypothetical protein AAF790_05730, partial [Planctomycetota bacterium]
LASPARPGDRCRVELRFDFGPAASGAAALPLVSLPQAESWTPLLATPSTAPESDAENEAEAGAENNDDTGGDSATGDDRRAAIRWAVTGMNEAPADSGAAAPLQLPTGDVWQAWRPPPSGGRGSQGGRVFWSLADDNASRLTAPLAEIRLRTCPHTEAVVTADYTVVPGGVTRCWLRVPAGHTLAAVRVDGAPTLCSQRTPRMWEVELRGGSAPQTIRAVVVGPARTDANARLRAPTLHLPRRGMVTPESVIWAAASSAGHRFTAPPGGRRASAGVTDVARLRALLTAALGNAQPTPGWLRVWRPRIEAAAGRVAAMYGKRDAGANAAAPGVGPQPAGVLENAGAAGKADDDDNDDDDQGVTLAPPTRLVVIARAWLSQTAGGPVEARPPAAVSPALERSPAGGAQNPSAKGAPATAEGMPAGETDEPADTFFATSPPAIALPSVSPERASGRYTRWLAAGLALAAAGGLSRRCETLDLAALAYRQRHLWMGAAGLLWWLLLQPSVAGLALLAASAVGQFRLLARRAAES